MTTGTRSAWVAALGCALVAALALPLAAQGPPQGGGRLNVKVGTTAIVFPDPGVLDFDVGRIDHSGLLVSVDSRPQGTAWELRIRADAATLGGYGKDVGDILWRTATSTAWTPLTGTDQTVAQGQESAEITVFFRMRLDWSTDLPGAYGAGITFSLIRP